MTDSDSDSDFEPDMGGVEETKEIKRILDFDYDDDNNELSVLFNKRQSF